MPDVTPDVSDAGANPAVSGGEVDPFLKLHKMSTTAGLGSGEYVAINGTAIASLLLGIASALVLFGANLLLLIPLAGIVCGILAFRQISDSNGTQTGRGLAIIGLLLSLGFGAFTIGKEVFESVRNSADEKQIDGLIGQLQADVKAEKYDEAYQLCDDHFKQRIPIELFTARFKAANSSPMLGRISGFQRKLMKFDNDPVTDDRMGDGLVLVNFEKITGQDRYGMIFRKLNDKWWLDDLPSLFPPERAGQGGGPGGPGGPGGAPPTRARSQSTAVPSGPLGPEAPK
jgi:hypothetical protein